MQKYAIMIGCQYFVPLFGTEVKWNDLVNSIFLKGFNQNLVIPAAQIFQSILRNTLQYLSIIYNLLHILRIFSAVFELIRASLSRLLSTTDTVQLETPSILAISVSDKRLLLI